MSSVFSTAFSHDPRVEPSVFANISSFVAFVSARACASVQRRLRNFLSSLLCKTFLHIRVFLSFHRGAWPRSNEEQARKHSEPNFGSILSIVSNFTTVV